jgi:branched-chain amino acid transport system permease protein
MLALWLHYNSPETSLSFEVMMDVLLIVVIGGMGSLYGAAIGSALFMVAQSYLQNLLQLAHDGLTAVVSQETLPWLGALVSAQRWLLWLGLLFVLAVYHFPGGITARLRGKV